MKKMSLIGIVLAILAGMSIFMSTFIATSAQVQGNSSVGNLDCLKEMPAFLEQKNKELQEYLKTNFQNKSTNTSLLDLALTRFQLYKNDLMNKFMTYSGQAGLSLVSEAMGSMSCYQLIQTDISLNEELLKKYFTQTSTIKTSSALMEKLKTINSKLDKLATSVAQMYGKFETLNNNVPCIIENCI